ncbi:MAG: adenosylcobinamide-GDP ribazoletransferase [gamma proteobacterium symbiont of Bathyaustriella thionipta]|nr:adenosylcobinamide-GDP ribazoletransferase [gamma proteobacterium symbiont of Bathyaustriella thionipta]MCU7948597.1 adenosylcobinamide-GDP ribazoletransferase [gamma proteobacterium symbiont of Bathyaustriella thionipta]MCU7952898.1 adenosylcobinamide-GDP ribazoletransferase [gamma proteobacterium symbiont of Bathyaustriella thionipta]MCU7955152.1 adenosylcobinamide-GDP ribazoletransferase [gamma proteobacterium symbiont of Bathyaustriella thionipta]MCU7967450.1 adenosylcobinamide-GDP ribaz
MAKQLRSFYIALSFLTRIATPLKGDVTQKQIGDSIIFYPVVGLLMGLIFFFITEIILFFSTDFSSNVLAAVLLTIWVLASGGLHLDGLADSADAWIGGLNDRDRTLEIMKDPYCGPIGVAMIVLVLLLKWTALSYLLKTGQSGFLIVLPMLSRSIIIVLFMTTVYVRESGLGSALLEYMPDESLLWAILLASALAYFVFANIFSMILVAMVVVALRMMMIQRIGGMTGDTLGATVEIVEAVALVGLIF